MPGPVTKAVFPVAGRGTRFLPATKASPKEMLPIVDKPLVQYAVEEAVAAGARDMIFITGKSKRAIEDHFDRDAELERELEDKGKEALLQLVHDIVPDEVNCIYIRQPEPLGLGHAVLCAEPAVGDEPFFVVLPDDMIRADTPCLQQMVQAYADEPASLVAVQRVPAEETHRYGIVSVGEGVPSGVGTRSPMDAIVEKPDPGTAPSDLSVVGRYLLSASIFERLRGLGRGAGGEIQLTDAIAALLADEPVHAYEFQGVRYDCGDKLGYLQATVDYALAHEELGPGLRDYLESVLKT